MRGALAGVARLSWKAGPGAAEAEGGVGVVAGPGGVTAIWAEVRCLMHPPLLASPAPLRFQLTIPAWSLFTVTCRYTTITRQAHAGYTPVTRRLHTWSMRSLQISRISTTSRAGVL